jgi:hypothetical protein
LAAESAVQHNPLPIYNAIYSLKHNQAAMACNEAKNASKHTNSRDSLVVTHPTTKLPACGLNAVNTVSSLAMGGDAA